MTTRLTHDKQKKANTTSNIIELSQAGTGTETDTAKQIRKQNRTEQKRTEQNRKETLAKEENLIKLTIA